MRRDLHSASVRTLIALTALAGFASAMRQFACADMQAGAFAADVTPKLPISLNGGMTDRKASVVHDPLHARCLVLADGRQRLAIVVVDSCMLPDEVVADAKRRIAAIASINPADVLISATHTHTAPTLAPTFQSDPDSNYVRDLPGRIAEGVRQAAARLRPATLSWVTADVPHQVFNRRWFKKPGTIPPSPFDGVDRVQMNPGVGDPNLVEPAGPTDPQVACLYLKDNAGRPICLLANYSLHYVGDVQSDAVSADYFGAFAQAVGPRLGITPADEFVGIMSNGTSGNINNIDFRKARPKLPMFGRTELVANDVAAAVAQAAKSAAPVATAPLAAKSRVLTLGVRKPTLDEIRRAERILAAAKGRPLRGLQEIYANETIGMAAYPDTKVVQIQAMRIGPIGIVAIPCEVFVEIGLKLKRQSPLKTFTISLANGYAGYLPTVEHHELGGYETWRAKSSCLERTAAPKIEAAALELLAELAGPDARRVADGALGPVEIVPQKSADLPSVTKVVAMTSGPKHHFFGYYGVDPWNSAGDKLACLEADFGTRLVRAGDRATIVWIDPRTKRQRLLAETTAWNHQQGAMMHWRMVAGQSELLFNDRIDGELATVAVDETGKRRTLVLGALAALAPDGTTAVGLNFDRLRAIRPVTGYAGGPKVDRIDPRPSDDGLWLLDLAKKSRRQLVSIEQCWKLERPPSELVDQPMWLEHPIFSRDGKRLFFMIRAFHPKTRQLVSMPMCMHIDGSGLKPLFPWAVNGASHFDWLDDRRLALTRTMRPGVVRHLLVDVVSGHSEELAPKTLKSDGHCSFSPDREWMVTDSYPDKNRRQHLYLMHVRTRQATRVASFHAPPEFRGDWRCDLHPRWHRDSKRICFDSTHGGTRQLYVAELRLPL